MEVWKYDLTIGDGGDVRIIECPRGSKFVYVGFEPSDPSPNNLRVWAVVHPTEPLEKRRLRIAGTGHPVQASARYIGSAVAPPFAWHVFETTLDESP